MKKIIQGIRYDTSAPRTVRVAGVSHGEYVTDFDHWSEDLYRTGRGRWFVVGEGGALSPYGRSGASNSSVGTSGNVRPLSDDQARQWLERAGETEAIEHYFPGVIRNA